MTDTDLTVYAPATMHHDGHTLTATFEDEQINLHIQCPHGNEPTDQWAPIPMNDRPACRQWSNEAGDGTEEPNSGGSQCHAALLWDGHGNANQIYTNGEDVTPSRYPFPIAWGVDGYGEDAELLVMPLTAADLQPAGPDPASICPRCGAVKAPGHLPLHVYSIERGGVTICEPCGLDERLRNGDGTRRNREPLSDAHHWQPALIDTPPL